MADPNAKIEPPEDESEKERLDRNLEQLLQELRVAIPGVQVLFAFLLVLPFQQRYPLVTSFEQTVYYVTLLATALATAFLIAPSARHRVTFRQGDKRWIVMTANRLAAIGLLSLAVAIVGVIVLISSFLYGTTAAIVAPVGIALVFAYFWFISPLLKRLDVK